MKTVKTRVNFKKKENGKGKYIWNNFRGKHKKKKKHEPGMAYSSFTCAIAKNNYGSELMSLLLLRLGFIAAFSERKWSNGTRQKRGK
jgi:hypothetical protein